MLLFGHTGITTGIVKGCAPHYKGKVKAHYTNRATWKLDETYAI